MEFSYNDKKYITTGQTPFELNFGRHLWKGNFMVQMEFPRREELFIGLERSWEKAIKAIEAVQEIMK